MKANLEWRVQTQFLILRQRTCVMSDVLMVSCDLHDRTMVFKSCVGREGTVRTKTVPYDFGSRRMLIERLKSDAAAAGAEKIVFAEEASGQGFGLFDQLREAGIECEVLAPTKMGHDTGGVEAEDRRS